MSVIEADKIKPLSESRGNVLPPAGKEGGGRGAPSGGLDLTLAVAVIMAAVISLGEVTLSLSSVRSITLLVCLLYILTTLVYRNRYSVNMMRGMECEAYVNAEAEYRRLRTLLIGRGLVSRVEEFCRFYTERELALYREGLLSGAGISVGDYEEKYKTLGYYELKRTCRLSHYAAATVLKCRRAKALRLNRNMILLSDGDAGERSKPFGMSSRDRQRRDNRNNMLGRVLVTLLSGAVAVSFIVDPSPETLIQWCVRMLPVISAAFSGSNNGYRNGSETATAYLSAQAVKIREFLEWAYEKGEVPAGSGAIYDSDYK